MGQQGGARPGAGRKPIQDQFKGTIGRGHAKIAQHMPEYIDSMHRLALGVVVIEGNPITGEPTVYAKAPDYRACEYMINRILGKPTERKEIAKTTHSTSMVASIDLSKLTLDEVLALRSIAAKMHAITDDRDDAGRDGSTDLPADPDGLPAAGQDSL